MHASLQNLVVVLASLVFAEPDAIVRWNAASDDWHTTRAFGDRMARVEFTQKGTDVHVAVSFDAEPTHSPEEQKAGCQAILDNFARYAEGRK